MSENETAAFIEAANEGKTARAVSQAVETAQRSNSEYWEIRQLLKDRMKWHGGGVSRQHVKNMDAVFNYLGKSPGAGLLDKVAAGLGKIFVSRLVGGLLRITSVPLDIVYNTVTWLPRKFLLVPKDPFKRLALLTSDALVGVFGAGVGLGKAEMAAIRGVKAGAEAVVTAPEVAAEMAKRRIRDITDKIKNPHQIDIPALRELKTKAK